MPSTGRFVQIGQVLKSNGTDGQLLVGLRGVDANDISEKELVYIFFDELPVPYFMSVDSLRGNSRLLVHMTDTDNLQDAEELVGRGVYWPGDEDFSDGPDIIGWQIFDQRACLAGEVSDFEDIPGNPCIEILTASSEKVLIPFNEDLIIDLDESGRTITMKIPEGLL